MFEGIVDWVSGVVTDLMDAVSGLFLNALGTDMTAMEEYFPFVASAFTVMQYIRHICKQCGYDYKTDIMMKRRLLERFMLGQLQNQVVLT